MKRFENLLGALGLLMTPILTSGCLAPSPAEPSPSRSTRTGVGPCSSPVSGAPRLMIRRGYSADPSFRLVQSQLMLDGAVVFTSTDEQRLRVEKEVVFDAPATPGRHEVTAVHRLNGQGTGAWSYMNGYRFRIPSKHAFDVRPIGGTCVTLTLFFRGIESLPLEEQPAFRHDVEWGASADAGLATQEEEAGLQQTPGHGPRLKP